MTEDVILDSSARLDAEAIVALAGIAAVSLFLELPKNLDDPDDDEEDNDVAVARRHAAASAEDEGSVETHLWRLWASTLTLMWQDTVMAEVAAVTRPPTGSATRDREASCTR